MCGICGIIGNGMSKQVEILHNMMNAMLHRGPDGGGSFFEEGAALGFRRLAIIDLDHGMQPMKNETGTLILVFNGEIYNYRTLREQLIGSGHRFETRSDSEVLLHGYEEWGNDLPNHLRGMFAFAIWDTKQRRLFAARDFFGIKPFYYTRAAGGFCFASEIKSLLQHPHVPKELNRKALEQYLSFQYSVLPETFFRGIFQLEPGSRLNYCPDTDTLEISRYFIPKLTPEEGKNVKEKEWMERLDRKIGESVSAHMVSDVEVGTFLSGGVDSNLLASRFGGRRAYTVGFDQKEQKYNEVSWARERARACRLLHRGRLLGEKEFFDAVGEVMYYMDEPTGDASAIALYFLAMEASRDVKVVLSGEGSDELFGGYRIYLEPKALELYQRLPLGLRRRVAGLANHMPCVRGRSFLLRGSHSVEERFIGNAKIFSLEERKKLLKGQSDAVPPQELVRPAYTLAETLSDAEKMQQVDLLYWLPGDILKKADRMSMAHSLEVRVPYLDRELFEFARRIPANLKQRGSTTKYLFRKVARRYLDPEASRRKKLGFAVPIRVWLREEAGYQKVRKLLLGEISEQFFDTTYLNRLLKEHYSGKRDHSRKIWTVYAFLVWYQVFFIDD